MCVLVLSFFCGEVRQLCGGTRGTGRTGEGAIGNCAARGCHRLRRGEVAHSESGVAGVWARMRRARRWSCAQQRRTNVYTRERGCRSARAFACASGARMRGGGRLSGAGGLLGDRGLACSRFPPLLVLERGPPAPALTPPSHLAVPRSRVPGDLLLHSFFFFLFFAMLAAAFRAHRGGLQSGGGWVVRGTHGAALLTDPRAFLIVRVTAELQRSTLPLVAFSPAGCSASPCSRCFLWGLSKGGRKHKRCLPRSKQCTEGKASSRPWLRHPIVATGVP